MLRARRRLNGGPRRPQRSPPVCPTEGIASYSRRTTGVRSKSLPP